MAIRYLLALAAVLACTTPALAADEEIQVYMDEMNPAGGYGLDVHLNHVIAGRGADADYVGQQSSEGRTRITPEFSYGLTKNFELGLYLPLATIDRSGRFEIGGAKARLKYIAPHSGTSRFFYGANFEIGHVRRDLDLNPWNAEAKLIGGYRRGRFTLAANLNFDFTVSGPVPNPATMQLANKATYEVHKGLALGIESYADLGTTRRFGLYHDGDNAVYAVVDKSFGHWDLDLGIGRGFGRPTDAWTIKAIVGVPIDGRQH